MRPHTERVRTRTFSRIPTPEGGVVKAVLELLTCHQKVAWAQRMNTGALKTKDRFVRFGFRGCADIIGQLKDGRFLAIECKSHRGLLTDEQEAFLERVRKYGGISGLARSVDDAQAILGAA